MIDDAEADSGPLDRALIDVESGLALLGEALRRRDNAAIEAHCVELHRALGHAVDVFTQAARQGRIPAALRERLSIASRHVAAQRESLARATAALDRAIDVLLPTDTPELYSSRLRPAGLPSAAGAFGA